MLRLFSFSSADIFLPHCHHSVGDNVTRYELARTVADSMLLHKPNKTTLPKHNADVITPRHGIRKL